LAPASAENLLNALESSLRARAGPVATLVLKKTAREVNVERGGQVSDDQARAMIDKVHLALSLIISEHSALDAAADMRGRMIELGLDV
jgi:hypothetical protein